MKISSKNLFYYMYMEVKVINLATLDNTSSKYLIA